MNVRLTWAFGSVSSKQRPIAKTVIEARVSATLPFAVINEVAAPETTLLHENADPGDWEYRATPVDDRGVSGPSSLASVSIPFDAPSGLASFTATPIP